MFLYIVFSRKNVIKFVQEESLLKILRGKEIAEDKNESLRLKELVSGFSLAMKCPPSNFAKSSSGATPRRTGRIRPKFNISRPFPVFISRAKTVLRQALKWFLTIYHSDLFFITIMGLENLSIILNSLNPLGLTYSSVSCL